MKGKGKFWAGGLIPEQAAPLLDRGQLHGDTEMVGVSVSKNMHDRQNANQISGFEIEVWPGNNFSGRKGEKGSCCDDSSEAFLSGIRS